MNLVAKWMTKNGKCYLCGSTEGEEHIHQMYDKAQKQYEYIRTLGELPAPQSLIDELVREYEKDGGLKRHFIEIEKLRRKKTKFFAEIDVEEEERQPGPVRDIPITGCYVPDCGNPPVSLTEKGFSCQQHLPPKKPNQGRIS